VENGDGSIVGGIYHVTSFGNGDSANFQSDETFPDFRDRLNNLVRLHTILGAVAEIPSAPEAFLASKEDIKSRTWPSVQRNSSGNAEGFRRYA